MTPMNPLSPEERLALMIATKIGGVTKKELIWIADQIREAEKETRAEGNSYKLSYWKKREEEAYAQGFSEAIEKAAKVAEEFRSNEIDWAKREYEIAKCIRSLKVGEEK